MKFFMVLELGKAIFINLAYVVRVEPSSDGSILTVRFVDGSAQQVSGKQVQELKDLLSSADFKAG